MTNETLCVMYQNGDPDALEQLYINNKRLIEKIIWRFRGYAELDDMRQESFLGLMKAAQLWKSESECTFLTYAVFWIRAAIGRYINNCAGVVRVPESQREQIRKYNRVANSYRLQFGRDPSDKELCTLLEISAKQLESIKSGEAVLNVVSTSVLLSDGETPLEETLIDTTDNYKDVIEKIQHEQLAAAIWGEVERLPEKERAVIRERYKGQKSLAQCGAALGISRQRVGQLESRALKDLRRPRAVRTLQPYLTEYGAYSLGISGGGLKQFNRTWESPQERAVLLMERLEEGRKKTCSEIYKLQMPLYKDLQPHSEQTP